MMKANAIPATGRRFSAAYALRGFLRHRLQSRARRPLVGGVRVRDPWGVWFIGDAREHCIDITVHDARFYTDLLLAGANGAASAWRDGFWSCADLVGLFRLLLSDTAFVDGLDTGMARLGNLQMKLRHRQRMNTRAGSDKNIRAHYDLGNEMFALFLDPTMTYSAAVFETADATLAEAAVAKLDGICRKLALGPDMHILEIGCGWGGLAIHAATRYGCRVTAATISRRQYQWAQQQLRRLSLESRVELLLCDYRDLRGRYDRIVSIEMIEAVGHRFLPLFFRHCERLLKDDGLMLLQAITMPCRRYPRYLKNTDFIQQFIFPGSCVPSVSALLAAAARSGTLQLRHLEDIAPHYAVTLQKWRQNFHAHEAEIRALGFGDDFIRLWHYYFCYCEAGFAQRYLGDMQMVFGKTGRGGPPVSKP